jgi:hypothetical protein
MRKAGRSHSPKNATRVHNGIACRITLWATFLDLSKSCRVTRNVLGTIPLAFPLCTPSESVVRVYVYCALQLVPMFGEFHTSDTRSTQQIHQHLPRNIFTRRLPVTQPRREVVTQSCEWTELLSLEQLKKNIRNKLPVRNCLPHYPNIQPRKENQCEVSVSPCKMANLCFHSLRKPQ